MKKFYFISIVLILIFFTTFIKNSTKKIEEKIYYSKENISLLKTKYEMVKLEYDFLTSPEKLINYHQLYFEEELNQIDINFVGKIRFKNDKILIVD